MVERTERWFFKGVSATLIMDPGFPPQLRCFIIGMFIIIPCFPYVLFVGHTHSHTSQPMIPIFVVVFSTIKNSFKILQILRIWRISRVNHKSRANCDQRTMHASQARKGSHPDPFLSLVPLGSSSCDSGLLWVPYQQ